MKFALVIIGEGGPRVPAFFIVVRPAGAWRVSPNDSAVVAEVTWRCKSSTVPDDGSALLFLYDKNHLG